MRGKTIMSVETTKELVLRFYEALFQTTNVSSSLKKSKASSSPVLEDLAPLALSVKILLYPICSKASFCRLKF
jgi:hypothetical protein